ncbi:hypothetical protein H1R20_g11924, partial [Candolleomyces eurysporus]
MRFVYLLLGLFATQVYASFLPLVNILKRGPVDPNTCQTCPNWATTLEQGCSNAQDFSCICTQDFSANFITCTECGLALSATVLPPDLQENLTKGADSYLQAILYICKNAYNIDIPGGHVTAPDVAAPQHTA